jgi:hypothetical protein
MEPGYGDLNSAVYSMSGDYCCSAMDAMTFDYTGKEEAKWG